MGKRVDLAALASEQDMASPADRSEDPGTGTTDLPVADIAYNPLNQRRADEEDPAEMALLVDTVRVHGVLQPLVVCTVDAFVEQFEDQAAALDGKRWVALIGNRRLAAAVQADQERVPAVVNNGRLASLYEVMLVENSHRKDLAPLREAEAMSRVLVAESISQRDLARRIGRTHTYVQQRLDLLNLVPALREAFEAGKVTVEQARGLGRLPVEEQEELFSQGPPFRSGGNAVATTVPRKTLKAGDPVAAARTIRALYSKDELSELIKLLTTSVGESSPGN